jgi:hypothetical protein
MYHRVGSACEKADPEHRKSQDWSFNGPDGRLRPACDKSPSRQGQGLCRSRHARKEQRFLSTVSISRCKAIRTAFTWAGACLTKSSRGCASIGKKSSARCFRCCDFHPRRRYGARFRLQGSGWHGRHQCPDPGCHSPITRSVAGNARRLAISISTARTRCVSRPRPRPRP